MSSSSDPQKSATIVYAKIGTDHFQSFALAVQYLNADETRLAFDVLTRFLRLDVRRNAKDVSTEDMRSFVQVLAQVTPYAASGMQSARLGNNVLISWVSQICNHLMASGDSGHHSEDQVRGYILMSFLGYKESHIDIQRDEMVWLGQRYELISENWGLFEERGFFDRDFILELESNKTKALLHGVL